MTTANLRIIIISFFAIFIFQIFLFKFPMFQSELNCSENLHHINSRKMVGCVESANTRGDFVGRIQDLIGNDDFSHVPIRHVGGFYEKGDGGGGTFCWDGKRDKSEHNGGTIIDPSHSGMVGSDEWYSSKSGGLGCWVRVFSGPVHASWFGAFGGFKSNSAILKIFELFNEIELASGSEYVISKSISVRHDLKVEGNGSHFSFQGSAYFHISGSREEFQSISKDIYPGERSICVKYPMLDTGNSFILLNLEEFSFSKHRKYYRLGDIFQVMSNTGSLINITEEINERFVSKNTKLAKINSVNVEIKNLSIKTTNTAHGSLRILYGRNVFLENVRVYGGAVNAISLESCYGAHLKHCFGHNSAAAGSHQYGLSISQSKAVLVEGGFYYGTRHGIAIGSSGQGVCRKVTIDGATIDNSGILYAADIHGSAIDVSYRNCTILNGSNISGYNAKLINNIIFSRNTGPYPAINICEIVGGDFQIEKNRVIMLSQNNAKRCIYSTNSFFLKNINYNYRLIIKKNEFIVTSSQNHILSLGTHGDNPTVRFDLFWESNTVTGYTNNTDSIFNYTGIPGSQSSPAPAPHSIIFHDFPLGLLDLGEIELIKRVMGTLEGTIIQKPVSN